MPDWFPWLIIGGTALFGAGFLLMVGMAIYETWRKRRR